MPAPLQSGAVLRRNTFHEITYASGCERAAAFYRNKDFVFIWFLTLPRATHVARADFAPFPLP